MQRFVEKRMGRREPSIYPADSLTIAKLAARIRRFAHSSRLASHGCLSDELLKTQKAAFACRVSSETNGLIVSFQQETMFYRIYVCCFCLCSRKHREWGAPNCEILWLFLDHRLRLPADGRTRKSTSSRACPVVRNLSKFNAMGDATASQKSQSKRASGGKYRSREISASYVTSAIVPARS